MPPVPAAPLRESRPDLLDQPFVQYHGNGLHVNGLEGRQLLGREIIAGVLRSLSWIIEKHSTERLVG